MSLNIILVILFVLCLLFLALKCESTRELFTTYNYTGKDGLVISANTNSNMTYFKKTEQDEPLVSIDNQTGEVKTNILKADNINLNKIKDGNSLDFQDIYKLETNGIESVDIDIDNDISIEGRLNSTEKIVIEGKTNLNKLQIGDYSVLPTEDSLKITLANDENQLGSVSINDVRFSNKIPIDSNESNLNITGTNAEFNNLELRGGYQTENIQAENNLSISGNVSELTSISTNKLEIDEIGKIDNLSSTSSIMSNNGIQKFDKIAAQKSILGNSNISEYLHTNMIDSNSQNRINILPGMEINQKNILMGENAEVTNILTGKTAVFKDKIILNKDFCIPNSNNPNEQKCITLNQIENLDAANKSNTKSLNIVETEPYKIQGCYKIGKTVGYPRLGLPSDEPLKKMGPEKCFQACPPSVYNRMAFHKNGYCTCGNEEDIDENDLGRLEKCRSKSGKLRGNKKYTLVYEYDSV